MDFYDSIIRGQIVLEDQVLFGEIGVKEGKIKYITEKTGDQKGKEVLEFSDAYVFPGVIDAHVHCFSNPKEGFTTTSLSAAVGGVTTFFDMPFDFPNPIIDVDQFRKKVDRLEKESVVDICLWGTIPKTGGFSHIKPLAEAGAVAFKMSTFETDQHRFPRIPDPEILKAFEKIRETGLRAAFHSENNEIIKELVEEYKDLGKVYPRAHMETRPALTETADVLKLMEFAYWKDVKLHIVHVSHPRTIELINYYKKQGVQVTAETCYQYLLLDVNDLETHGPKAKVNPPLRTSKDVTKMWNNLQTGNIDLISSDHAAWENKKKEAGKENIFLSASGMPGLEIMVPLMFSEGVNKGKITVIEFAKLMSQHPAEVFQIPKKGKIDIGYDADLTIIDPKISWTVDETKFQSQSNMTPFHGKRVQGKVVHTIVRGTTVYDSNSVKVKPGFGRFVPGVAAEEI